MSKKPREYVLYGSRNSGSAAVEAALELARAPYLIVSAATWDKTLEYLLICRSGGRSANAAMAMTRAGFAKAINLVGGMIAWNQAGLKTER